MTSVNTNVAMLSALRSSHSSQSLTDSLQRLSSGLRVNSPPEDSSGQTISGSMNAASRGMGSRRVNEGDSSQVSISREANAAYTNEVDSPTRILAQQQQQSGTSILTQANQNPNAMKALMRG
jgi:flagellin